MVGANEPQPLIYLDQAASTHPPSAVLDAYRRFLEHSYANVHRGSHYLAQAAGDAFEAARERIRCFIAASGDDGSVILLGNTTQALDLAAHLMAPAKGVTLVSLMEHHSNDLPHRARGRVVHFVTLPDGTLDYDDLDRKLDQYDVKLVAVTGASNVTGDRPDVHRVARMAHARGARILVDGAQLLAHARIDVRPEGDPEHIDFLAAAGHKAYAPFGSSFLYAPRALCDAAPPSLPGGGTVAWVTEDAAFYRKSPARHEGGTPNVAGAVALGESLAFLARVGMESISAHERALAARALEGLRGIDGVTVLGHPDPDRRLGVISFTVDGTPHERVARLLDCEAAIAVRNGCFCAQPYLHRLLGLTDTSESRRRREAGDEGGLPGAVRASIGIYNDEEEIETLIEKVREIRDRSRRAASCARRPRACDGSGRVSDRPPSPTRRAGLHPGPATPGAPPARARPAPSGPPGRGWPRRIRAPR